MIHRINYIFVITSIVWASCFLVKRTEGSLTQLDYCHQNKDTAIACCTCVFYHQSSNPNECDKPCPPDYYTIIDNKYSCKEEQPTSTAIPTTNLNPTTPKVPDSYYCIRQCASGEYYDKRLLKCQTCPTHCLECNDEENCTTCYVKHENECLQECPEGFSKSVKNIKGSIMCKESETVSQSEIIAIGSAVGVVVLLVGFAIVIVKLKRRTAGRTQRDSEDSNQNAEPNEERTPSREHKEEEYTTVTIPPSDESKLPDENTEPTKKRTPGRVQKEEEYMTVTIPPACKTKPSDLNTKSNKERPTSREHKEEDYMTVTIPPAERLKGDRNTKPTKERATSREHNEEDYMTVTIPPSVETKPDENTEPTKERTPGRVQKEEEYMTVTIPPSVETKPPDQINEPNEERTESREHKEEEDYMTVIIPPARKSKPENEKQDMKADKKQENADGDDSTNPPPLPKRLEKSKTEVEEKDGNVQDEICIIPTSLRRCNKIVIDG